MKFCVSFVWTDFWQKAGSDSFCSILRKPFEDRQATLFDFFENSSEKRLYIEDLTLICMAWHRHWHSRYRGKLVWAQRSSRSNCRKRHDDFFPAGTRLSGKDGAGSTRNGPEGARGGRATSALTNRIRKTCLSGWGQGLARRGQRGGFTIETTKPS
ncbi:uncharacterized protein BCR38DRAFT_168033 [Pseudomassariella vexata]|uniref:Uncharacterized protein n=1 Tax=Pseudomassariella vexata TaxID=1141098 RepID=A0A1Y2E2U6_9PEZI|nr:uncharacterized protein BCR38DRAFT_168033 [Pseudomassariella vexata]ORY65870.1 hypothetical protein BCR38DRAFT_168033 [Pseudomassariella vexata]